MSTIDPRPKSTQSSAVHGVAESSEFRDGHGLPAMPLPAVKVGSQWRVDSERLNLFLSERVSVMGGLMGRVRMVNPEFFFT